MKEINLMTWFSERELDFCPKHFVKTNTPLSPERREWIVENCKGRYYVQSINDFTGVNLLSLDDLMEFAVPYFEDPQEAILYELKWS
jgi:hypothetical protein